ncbi:Retrovirus-related Pol polyprotein from transposon TNT 1-94 [Gossypium australe]|uniref:Retrovirus-related Pol polyprotein from transposon TNT 1-94 n=1 Tax=Gossypium australe TaxID=47621 RepID=A0A5B6VC01_9ROSI|nr:Retrovirus-related Pol polyprotein from transposon TNT 1-94 [Gossypium australe]
MLIALSLVILGIFSIGRYQFLRDFSPTVKPTTIRMVVALVVTFGWPLNQVDINDAFLNGNLTEDIYMLQPPGFEKHCDGQQLVCKLRKALYSFRQASRDWFHKLKEYLVAAKFVVSKFDASLFFQQFDTSLIYMLVYVDDIIINGNNTRLVYEFVCLLNSQFALKDLGKLSYFLRIKVTYTPKGLFLNQRKYILDLLQRSMMDKSKGSPTPMVTTCSLSTHVGIPMEDESIYRSIVGVLQYIVITLPAITFAVNKACQFMHKPLDFHFKAVKRILRYLQNIMDQGLFFTPTSKLGLQAYLDANWGTDIDGSRLTIGFCWEFDFVELKEALSEGEYRSLAHATTELIWLKALLKELRVDVTNNSGAITAAANLVLHSKFKHVELDLFCIREKIVAGTLQIGHVPSQDQVVDILTKPLFTGFF